MSSHYTDNPDRLQILAGSFFFLASIYCGLLWCGVTWLYRPTWIPVSSEEPITFVLTVITALITFWYKIFKSVPKGVKVEVAKSEFTWPTYLLADHPQSRDLSLSLWIENNEQNDLAINSVCVYPVSSGNARNVVYKYEDTDVLGTIQAGKSKNVKVKISAPGNGVAYEEFCLEISFISGKMITSYFKLSK